MNKIQYIENFKKGDKSAVLRINRPIHSDPAKGISGEQFSREHDFLVANGVEEVLIPINSVGGNVFQGLEIFATIQDSPMKTETRVVGIAASMAGVISQAGDKRTIKEHALFHAHSPRAEAGRSVNAEMIDLAYNQLKTIFTSNTTMDESAVDELLGKESFLSAEPAIESGLFDEVIDSNLRISASLEDSPEALAKMFEELENVHKPAKAKINRIEMSKINSLLGLEAEAAEKSTIEAVTQLQAQAAEVEQLQNKVEILTNELKSAAKEKATALIENAIESNKIEDTHKEALIENAIGNFEATKLMIDGIKSSATSPDILGTTTEGTDVSADWKFQDWGKNDPKGLGIMKTENRAKYDKLFNEYVG